MDRRHVARNVLVTGGAGFIGSNYILHALDVRPGWRIVNLDKLTYAADPANLATLHGVGNYRFVQGDICDAELVTALLAAENIDTVVHFAAESHVDRSIAEPAAFVRTNVLGTQCLLEACRTVWPATGDFRFHHISTDEVFGSLSADAPAFCETTPYAPNSPYSASKAAADHLVHAYAHTYGLPTVLTNCSNNYGPRQHAEKFIPTVIRKAVAGESIPVYGNGANVRDWLFVDDHCDALLLALERGVTGARYCIGGGVELSNIDLARRICQLLDEVRPDGAPHDRLITYVADRPGHDFRYAVDAGKIAAELGWTARARIDDGLRQTIDWYLGPLSSARPAAAEYGRPQYAPGD